MLYAVGPISSKISFNSPSADLGRHDLYGRFGMDYDASVSDLKGFGNPQGLGTDDVGSQGIDGGDHKDHDLTKYTYELLTVRVFLIIFPFRTSYVKLHGVRVAFDCAKYWGAGNAAQCWYCAITQQRLQQGMCIISLTVY